jgi:hypothetical protein
VSIRCVEFDDFNQQDQCVVAAFLSAKHTWRHDVHVVIGKGILHTRPWQRGKACCMIRSQATGQMGSSICLYPEDSTRRMARTLPSRTTCSPQTNQGKSFLNLILETFFVLMVYSLNHYYNRIIWHAPLYFWQPRFASMRTKGRSDRADQELLASSGPRSGFNTARVSRGRMPPTITLKINLIFSVDRLK